MTEHAPSPVLAPSIPGGCASGSSTADGIGASFYGKRDFRADGSYVTTQWAVCFHIPILPLRSFRVRRSASQPRRAPAPLYEVYEKTWPNWKQVLYIYGYSSFILFWLLIFAAYFGGSTANLNESLRAAIFILTFFWPFVIPAVVRLYARRRLRTEVLEPAH